jgi:hypothetical protein
MVNIYTTYKYIKDLKLIVIEICAKYRSNNKVNCNILNIGTDMYISDQNINYT